MSMGRGKRGAPVLIRGISLRITAPAQAACLLSPLLTRVTGRGSEVFQRQDDNFELRAFLEEARFRPKVLARIEHQCQALAAHLGRISFGWEQTDISKRPPKGEKRFFRPFHVTSGLWVAPPGSQVELGEAHRLIELEPGDTSLCGIEPKAQSALRLLEDLLRQRRFSRALDVCCGAGVFSLAAALWGVPRVLSLDRNPNCVRLLRRNASRNNLARAVRAKCLPFRRHFGSYPLVMTVCSHRLVLREARHLIAVVAPGGCLLVGGIWHSWTDSCLEALCPTMELVRRERSVWWETVLLSKPGP